MSEVVALASYSEDGWCACPVRVIMIRPDFVYIANKSCQKFLRRRTVVFVGARCTNSEVLTYITSIRYSGTRIQAPELET